MRRKKQEPHPPAPSPPVERGGRAKRIGTCPPFQGGRTAKQQGGRIFTFLITFCFLFLTSCTPTQTNGLNPNGAWLLLATSHDSVSIDGLWAINPDGSGLTQLVEDRIVGPNSFGAAVSPSGGYVATISASDTHWHDLTLNLLHLPDGRSTILTALTSEQTEPPPEANNTNHPDYVIAQAIAGQGHSLVWSPDGSKLAFIGAMQGDSADLYLYDVATETITRLSDEPAQAMRPRWSPGGSQILFETYEVVLLGRFIAMEVWLVDVDAPSPTLLYQTEGSDEEQFAGWLGENRYLVYSRDVACGWNDLRIVNLDGGDHESIWPGYFNKVSNDPQGGSLIISVDEYTASCTDLGEAGLFHLTLSETSPERIGEFTPRIITWSHLEEMFYAVTNEGGVYSISTTGDVVELDPPVQFVPILSADGSMKIWSGQAAKLITGSLWLEDSSGEITLIYEGGVQAIVWSPDGSAIFFIGDRDLYRLDVAGGASEPVLLREGMPLRDFQGMLWVGE